MQLSDHNINILRKTYSVAGQPRRVRRKLSQLDFGEQIVSFGDLKLQVNPKDNYTDRIVFLTGSSPEPESIKTLQNIIKDTNALVLDVGANSGTFSTSLASVIGPKGIVRAYEPNPVMFERLMFNVKLNKLDGKVDVNQAALSSDAGTAKLKFATGNFGLASLAENVNSDVGAIDVKMLALSDQLRDSEKFDLTLMKVDIEGYEPELFANLDKTTPKNLYPDFILIETAHTKSWSYDLVEYLISLGYVADFTGEGNTLFKLKK